MDAKISLIKRVYTDPSNPVAFSTPRRTWLHVKKINPSITLELVKRILTTLDAYTLHRPVRRIIKGRRYISPGLNKYFQIDLMVLGDGLARTNFNHYILVAIDAFSRKLFVVPLKTKSGPEVAAALEQIVKENHGIPMRKIVSDKGREFLNAHVKRFMDKYNVIHFTTENIQHAALAERVIRTLREKIGRYLTHKQTRLFVPSLKSFVTAYNNRPHSALPDGMSPEEVNPKNELKVWKHQYARHFRRAPGFYGTAKFSVGDTVRLSEFQGRFKKSTDATFTKEKFVVTHILETKPRTYKVAALKDGEEILGAFYAGELIKS